MSFRTYISDVVKGKQVACELVRLACERHLRDIERQRTAQFPYYFDEAVGAKWVKFANLCKQWKGSGARTNITLQPWQDFYMMELFGWQRVSGGRRYRTAYLEIGRKNGKTSLCAIKALGHILIDKEPGAQVYIAATKEEQARIAFRDVQEIIKATPALRSKFTIYVKSVTAGPSFIKPLGSDSDTQDGFDPSYGIIDEYHAHPTSGMLNVIESGMGARSQPLIDIITTAGFNRMSPCFSETRKTSIDVLKGIKQDDTHLAMIYTLDDGDDWKDETVWIKANPNLDVSVRMDFLRDRMVKAVNEGGSKEVDFKTKNLNIWTDALSVWIPDERWMSCADNYTIEDCLNMPCYFALDLASTMDTTSLALLFVSDNQVRIINEYFIPEGTIERRSEKDGVMYRQWSRDGHMNITQGNVTDYDYIRTRLNELRTMGVQFVCGAYDDWNSSDLIPRLTDDGFVMEPMTQNIRSMSTPTKEFEKMVYQGRVVHNGHPVTRWQMSNVMIKRDANENYKIAKDKSTEKVDGPVSITMAVALVMKYKEEDPTYEVEIW